MFFLLRWIARLLFTLVLAGIALWLWQYRSALDPAWDLWDAYQAGRDFRREPAARLRGEVVAVYSGETIQIRADSGLLYNVRLAGIDAPDPAAMYPVQTARALRSRDHLQSLILSNRVELEITLTNESRGVIAAVHRGRTNINAAMITARYAEFRPEWSTGLPLSTRYALFRANRSSRNGSPARALDAP